MVWAGLVVSITALLWGFLRSGPEFLDSLAPELAPLGFGLLLVNVIAAAWRLQQVEAAAAPLEAQALSACVRVAEELLALDGLSFQGTGYPASDEHELVATFGQPDLQAEGGKPDRVVPFLQSVATFYLHRRLPKAAQSVL